MTNISKINYLSKDWESINTMMKAFTARYFPNVSEDQSDASFISMLFGNLSLIGDQLHFYQDYYANEEFISSCSELESVYKHGRQAGFTPFLGNTAIGTASFFAEVPADSSALGPDVDYLPVLDAGSIIASRLGTNFILTDGVVFDSTDVRVGRVDMITGTPTTYIVKNFGNVISGEYKTEEFEVLDFQTFLKVRLSGINVAEILSVVDSEGNEYFQVDNLSQNIVYKAQVNFSGGPSNVLIPYAAPRRFVFSRDSISYYLMFGSGSDNVNFSEYLENPQMCLNLYGKKYITSFDLDPNKIVSNDKFGVAPEDTVLTVTYRAASLEDVNVGVGSLSSFLDLRVKIQDEHLLDADKVNNVKSSITVMNEKPIVGFTSFDNIDELKERVIGHNNCQDRAVSVLDYINMVYKMPKNFGSVKRVGGSTAFIGNRTFVNLFVVSEDGDFKLAQTTDGIKQNIIKWINGKKISSDNINVFDCQIINLGFDFEIIVASGYNKIDVLIKALSHIRSFYFKTFNIGQNFDITEIFSELISVNGVIDVSKIRVFQKRTGDYSSFEYDLDDNLTVDGKSIEAKAGVIFEIKYPLDDISGSAR